MSFFDEEEGEDLSIDLTPLLDVLFIFLIFFIVTASFSQPMLNLNLPKSESARAVEANKEDIILHLVGGKVFQNDEEITDLETFFKEIPSDGRLIFQVEEHESFGDFVTLVDSAKAGGRDDFLIQTRRD